MWNVGDTSFGVNLHCTGIPSDLRGLANPLSRCAMEAGTEISKVWALTL